MKNLKDYYEKYWEKRGASKEAISPNVPNFLRKYTYYGAILDSLKAGSKILDLGCGNGSVTKLYLGKGKVFGVDISEEALDLCSKEGIKDLKQHDLNKLPLPFSDGSFDYIIATDVIEHIIDPLSLLKDMRRVLKKDGSVIFAVPNFARFGNRLRMLLGDPIDILHWSKYGDDVEHLHWFTGPKIKYLLEEASYTNFKYLPAGLRGNFVLVRLGLANLSSFLVIKAKK